MTTKSTYQFLSQHHENEDGKKQEIPPLPSSHPIFFFSSAWTKLRPVTCKDWRCSEMKETPQNQDNGDSPIAHTIHVRYIYLHLVELYGKCREIYRTWMLWVVNFVMPDPQVASRQWRLLFGEKRFPLTNVMSSLWWLVLWGAPPRYIFTWNLSN